MNKEACSNALLTNLFSIEQMHQSLPIIDASGSILNGHEVTVRAFRCDGAIVHAVPPRFDVVGGEEHIAPSVLDFHAKIGEISETYHGFEDFIDAAHQEGIGNPNNRFLGQARRI